MPINLAPNILHILPLYIIVNMEKIIRFRDTQTITLDDFIEQVLNKPSCAYCQFYDVCSEDVGCDMTEVIDGGCSQFDNSILGLKKIYLKQFSVKNS